jgi:hypothetical protein
MGDPGDSARAIGRILDSRELAAAMSRAGQERAARFYRQDLVLDRYRGLYTALANRLPIPDDTDESQP